MTENEQIGERLNAVRNLHKLTQTAFAQRLGVKQGFVNSVIKGKKGIGHNIIINIAKEYKELNLRWLLLGEGEMFLPEKIYPPPSNGTSSAVEDTQQPAYHKEGRLERIERLLRDHETRLCAIEQKE